MQARFPDGSVVICGTVHKDAEYKEVGTKNSSMTKFSVKAGERVNGGQKETIWVNCVCWHSAARATANIKKFDVILCVGRIKENEYNGKTYKNLECEFVIKMDELAQQSQTYQPQQNTPLPSNMNEFEQVLDDGTVPF